MKVTTYLVIWELKGERFVKGFGSVAARNQFLTSLMADFAESRGLEEDDLIKASDLCVGQNWDSAWELVRRDGEDQLFCRDQVEIEVALPPLERYVSLSNGMMDIRPDGNWMSVRELVKAGLVPAAGVITKFNDAPAGFASGGIIEPIPIGVYFSEKRANGRGAFYDVQGFAKDAEFYYRWKNRAAEFPRAEPKAAKDAEAEFGIPFGGQIDLDRTMAAHDGWEPWDGTAAINGDLIVDYRMRDGETVSGRRAGDVSWRHYGTAGDIVAWRRHTKVAVIDHIVVEEPASNVDLEPAMSIDAGVETRKILVLSTAHLTLATNQWLDSHDPKTEWPACGGPYGPHGWFFYASEENLGLGRTHIPDDLFAVMTYARKLGCDNILFDQDADKIDALPSWEW